MLATSFGLYGLVRKMAPVEPVAGFGVEMTVLTVPSLLLVGWLVNDGTAQLPTEEPTMNWIVAGSGFITAAPLLCFNAAAKRLRLVTVGILQYIAPSLTLVLAVVFYGEPFETVHRVTFGCVWLALAIFTVESIVASRRAVS